MSFSISKKYSNSDWNILNLIDENSPNWNDGIDIIRDRFESRFFQHIRLIENNEFSGFLVMSIDCLLIETFMQFYLGIENTEEIYKGNQWKSFRDFLKNSIHFKTDFKTNKICHTFYTHFRCGLLHQAQTKQESLIKICQEKMLSFSNSIDIGKGLIIDRKQFHEKMVLEFNGYLQGLDNNDNNFKDENLRRKAILKMGMICKE
jgi:hypothetical protein